MSASFMLRYWIAGLVLAPVLIIYAIATSNAGLTIIGIATFVSAIGMTVFFRRRVAEGR